MANKTKILCVEDEVDIRENLADILESEGFEVFQAENGKDGLEKFMDYHPDIIISDIMMPELTGHQLLQAIRENKEIENNNVPFILLSALGQKEDVIKGINLEASDYMVKPVDFDLLIAKIKEKSASLQKTKEVNNKNIANLKSQVSNMVPQEMLQYVDLINQISGVLKTEIYGPLPHQKYIEDLNKIYIHSLRLKSLVDNMLSGTAISNQIDISDEIINPLKFIENFVKRLNEKYQSKISIDDHHHDLPDIKINKKIISSIVKKCLACIFKLNHNAHIKIIISADHLNRLSMIFYPDNGVDENILKEIIHKSIPHSQLDDQGLIVEVLFSNNKPNVILTIPDYRVSK
jgi:CheY-like chemotaxis protein